MHSNKSSLPSCTERSKAAVENCGSIGNSARPFLRWAGGKSWFVKYLPSLLNGLEYQRYYEPFLGGGSVFFALKPKDAVLSDLNADLIVAYTGIRDDVEDVVATIGSWPVSEERYYEVRAASPSNQVEQAARFIYLNRTSFKGIWRVNRKGQYNVPYGRKDDYEFDCDQMRKCSRALQGVTLKTTSFEDALKDVCAGSLVFLDPPYTVSHNNNGFIEYNKTLFSLESQKALRRCIDRLNETGAYFIMTNAAHKEIKSIFDGIGEVYTVSRNCTLGGKHAKRGLTEELVFTNIPGANIGVVS